VFKNFSFSIAFKVVSAVMMFISVPLLLKILGKHDYGIWAALTSLLVWISLFDFGIGYALKNTVSKALANDNLEKARAETIQTLKFMLIFCVILLVLFFVLVNSVELLIANHYLAMALFIPAIIIFPLSMGNMILQGARKVAFQAGLMMVSPFIFLSFLLVGSYYSFEFSLLWIGVIYSISTAISLSLVWFYSSKKIGLNFSDYKKITSAIIKYERLRLGLKFFGLQVTSIVLYSMGPIIIITFLHTEDVADFDILNKIFLFGMSIFSIGISVFWPELTHHREKKNYAYIYKIYFTMIALALLFSIGSFIFAFIAPSIIELWTGNIILVRWDQAIWFSLLVSIQAFAYSGAVVLNAYEQINIQLVIAVFSTILMLPLTILFINDGYGIVAIPISASILTIIPAIYCNLHAFKIIKKEKSGLC